MEIHKIAHNKLVGGAVLAALSALIMYVSIPIIPGFTFLKLDISDVIIVIAFFAYGYSTGLLTAFCKILLHWVLTGMNVTSLIGDFSAFLSTIAFVLPLVYFWKKDRYHLTALLMATLCLTVVMSIANYFFVMPLYMKVLNFNINMPISRYVAIGVIPFNLIKGIVLSLISILIVKHLRG